MNMRPRTDELEKWLTIDPDERPGPGHEAHVREQIAIGKAQIAAGKGITAEDIRKEFGLE
ncbi:hypothetical protein [Amaricoccus tamworthensis]|uniref:hypothetical protein n=1 Tax=Amaricoccus tamworthensis TaxID=57002 RepID=UPI003C7E9F7C